MGASPRDLVARDALAAGARITAERWSYRYPGRAEAAVTDASFTVEPGQLVVLLGASGSGKSTLLRGLAGVLPEGESSGTLAGIPAPVGLVLQDPQSNIVMETVGDDLAFPLENRGVPPAQIWSKVEAARAAVGLEPAADRRTATLSGGQLQLLAIAAATVGTPSLLLLDEPTANLDAAAADAVVRTVLAERERTGCTVVVIEHRVAPWLRRADLVLVADQGVITPVAAADLPGFLATRPELARRVWLADTDLPDRRPEGAAGEVAVRGDSVSLARRLAPTDLTVAAGEIVALTGAPGSGKSTLLACLAGLLKPDHGSVALADGRRDPWTWPAAAVPRAFGVVFQNPEHQFLTGSARAELEHGLDPTDPAVRARVDELLARLGLERLATADPFTLSGGEQRRLSVGTALVARPEVLVLDEPTFGQDPATWREVVAIIAEHRDAGGAVVIATHDPLLVTALGAREVRLTAVREDSEVTSERAAETNPAGSSGSAREPARAGSSGDAAGEVGIGSAMQGALGPRGADGLRSLDPLGLLGTAALLTVAALLSASVPFNLAVAVGALVAGLVGGLSPRWVAVLAVPAAIATGSVALSNALLGEQGLLSWESWQAAALPASRILAVAVPGLIAAAALDPTGLADGLVVRLRVGPRAAYSVLAGLRLLPLLADEWGVLTRASRARGLGGRGPVARLRLFASMAFRLLVSALRRGGRLAVALDARGLTGSRQRTVARPVRWRARDTVVLVGGVLVLVLAILTR